MPPIDLPTILTWVSVLMIGVGVVGFGSMLLRSATAQLKRRERLAGDVSGMVSGPHQTGTFMRLTERIHKLGGLALAKDPGQHSALRAKLMRAGFSSREAVSLYLGVRTICLGVAVVGTLVLTPLLIGKIHALGVAIMACALTGVAVLGPEQVIGSRRVSREREYREGFPDLLDLLVASVEAGLSLDAAVSRITEELVARYPNLAAHLYLMTLEFRAGQARRDAWMRLADRLGIDEARSFATMLRQAEEMGASVGETLSVFADDMRQKRMLRAEEKALALPAKMMLPLILFIFPCLIGVLMLPAAVKIAHTLHH